MWLTTVSLKAACCSSLHKAKGRKRKASHSQAQRSQKLWWCYNKLLLSCYLPVHSSVCRSTFFFPTLKRSRPSSCFFWSYFFLFGGPRPVGFSDPKKTLDQAPLTPPSTPTLQSTPLWTVAWCQLAVPTKCVSV